MKTYNICIEDDSEEFTISLVETPAIEENFIALNKKEKQIEYLSIEDKKEIIGAILIPNKLIYRNDNGNEYNIVFNAETIEKIVMLWLNNHNFSLAHKDNVDNIALIECWIKTTSTDKSNYLGFDLPIGTAFIRAKVMDNDIWEAIKTHRFNGFSIEGFVNYTEINEDDIKLEQIKELLKNQ